MAKVRHSKEETTGTAAEGDTDMRRGMGRHHGEDTGDAVGTNVTDQRGGRCVVFAFALCFGTTSAALAADLPVPGPIPPAVYAAPVYNWTGLYIGGNIGAAWSGLSGSNFSDTLGSTFTAPTNVQFVGGGQVGVNYQFWSGVVIGAEVMFDWLASSQNTQITATAPDGTAAFMDTINNRWLTTATGRLGYAWDRVLLYGKAGGAWLGAGSPGISVGGAPVALTSSSGSDFGWTAGFGLEWAFWNNWSVRAEYDFIGLNNQSFTVAPGPTTFGGDVVTYSYRSISVMNVAVNYKFGGW
jgi:outer membrane immunogenic protein